ncbi:hypothetical protein GTP45_07040 [Pseudoduganella sp. FT55W]|uniref:Uncharacterized protein n=1 Tax=Duganella rivi TaxID=2666083 RepID=A0A7X4KAU6_9BURK|nr:hypothetical protein [Duganella rivi]MYM66594.1 hypothetical protein [Duganella rivi]
MKNIWMTLALACSLSATATAQQTTPQSSSKTSESKAAKAKSPAKNDCSGMQGGVDASGGESVEVQAKASKTTAANSANCGKHNGKAATPEAAPTTPHPDVKR